MNIAKYIGTFVLVAMLAACSTEDEQGGNAMGNVVEINASIGENGLFTRSNPLGDETTQKIFNAEDQISVSKDGESVIYTFNGETWTSEDGKFLCWKDGEQTFNAFYPVSNEDGNNSFESGTVLRDQTTEDNLAKSDFMTVSTTEAMPADRKLSLSFERKTARVIVKATSFGTEFPEGSNPYINAVTVFSQQRVPSKSSGYLGQINAYRVENKESKKDNVFYALVSPDIRRDAQKFLHLVVCHTTTAGNPYTQSYNVIGIPEHKAGKSYTYNLKIGKDKVTIENVTVEDWETGDVIPGGDALTPEEAVAKTIKDILAAGKTEITLNLQADAGINVFQAIKESLEGVAAGSISLTLKGCTEIPDDALCNRTGKFTALKSVSLPNVKKIGKEALANCGNLEEIYAPNVNSIQGNAFGTCQRLNKVTLGNITEAKGMHSTHDGIFDPVVYTEMIDLVLSEEQECMTYSHEIVWKPDGTKYKWSSEYESNSFLNYKFQSVKFW